MTPAFIASLLSLTPGWAPLADRTGLDPADLESLLSEAARLSEDALIPLAAHADAAHCRVEDGRVKTPSAYPDAYRLMGGNGWLTADLPEAFGGQDLPVALHAAASLFFEGAAMPFMMLAGSSRAGAHCLAAHAPDLAAEWGPKLSAGEWALTICISEPDAGSDVGRIRTRATQQDGIWRLSGKKCWISFGDHDVTARIGHLALARTGAPEDGTRGLSLFLVPDRDETGRNAISVERIEEKLGLHGSPTCVLNFEGARAIPVGPAGRGLPTLFAMIELMRLQTGCQGAGVSMACARLARAYAAERRQGGRPDRAPVPILSHPDVLRMVTKIEADAALAAAMVLEAAAALDAAKAGDAAAGARAAFLLPLAKTFGGETAFDAASMAIQVFGGAGYTREWPVERHLRDARIITIYEGATGMQAQDFLLRRLLKDEGVGMRAVLDGLAAERASHPDPAQAAIAAASALRFEALAENLTSAAAAGDMGAALRGADGCLRAGWALMRAHLALRVAQTGPEGARLARFALHFAADEMSRAETAALLPAEALA